MTLPDLPPPDEINANWKDNRLIVRQFKTVQIICRTAITLSVSAVILGLIYLITRM